VPYGTGLFLWLPDCLWKEIGYRKNQYACAPCTIKRVEKVRNFLFVAEGTGEQENIGEANLRIKVSACRVLENKKSCKKTFGD
jgi:hypothetical protein